VRAELAWPDLVSVRLGFVVFLLLSWEAAVRGQDLESNPWFLRAGITQGHILSANPFLANGNDVSDPIRSTPNVTVEIGRQTDGSKDWHAMYGMPSYGFGFSFVSVGNGVETGRPMEAYTFFSWPFAHLNDRLEVTTDFGMGLGWHWKMNENSAASGDVLGSDLVGRINWGFYLRYALTPRLAVYTGMDFTHRSNGGTAQPNRGLNVIGPKVAVQYGFSSNAPRGHDPDPPSFAPRGHDPDPPSFQQAWEFVIGGAGGIKNVVERSSPVVRADFGAFDMTAAVQRQFYRYGKIAAGTDLVYDDSTGVSLDGAGREWRADAAQRWAVGVCGGYEHVIGRFSALLQVGDYVARGFSEPNSPHLYSRYGWRYHVNDRVWSTLAIRATGFRNADALEFGVGYRIRRLDGEFARP
jgi:hypothetical protein